MGRERTRALSEVLDQLESSANGDSIRDEDVIEKSGRKSFASLMLVISLISALPASAIPGITATAAAITFILVVKMIAGRNCLWLPRFITQRHMSTARFGKGSDGCAARCISWNAS